MSIFLRKFNLASSVPLAYRPRWVHRVTLPESYMRVHWITRHFPLHHIQKFPADSPELGLDFVDEGLTAEVYTADNLGYV